MNVTVRELKWRFEDWRRTRVEKLQMRIAWALPKWLWKWTVIRGFSAATTGRYGNRHPDDVRYGDVMDAIDEA